MVGGTPLRSVHNCPRTSTEWWKLTLSHTTIRFVSSGSSNTLSSQGIRLSYIESRNTSKHAVLLWAPGGISTNGSTHCSPPFPPRWPGTSTVARWPIFCPHLFFGSNWKQPHPQMHIHVEQHWHQAPLLSGKKRVSQIIQYKDYSKLHIVSVTNIRDTRSPLPFQCSCPCALAFKSVSLEDMVSRYQTAVAPIIQGNGYHCPEWSCSECLLDGWHCLQWPRPRLQSPVVLWRVIFCH